MTVPRALVLAGVLVFGPAAAGAQVAVQLADSGISAYNDLEYDRAADLLTRAAAAIRGDSLLQTRVLSYLAATHVFRNQLDSASIEFRQLLLADPAYRLDALVFPPDVAVVFETVREQTKAIKVRVPSQSQLRLGVDRWSLQLFATSAHSVAVEVARAGAAPTVLYEGAIGDSLTVQWNPAADTSIVNVTSATVSVRSTDRAGREIRRVTVPLTLTALRRDTLLHPSMPADSLFVPERAPARPRYETLVGGLGAGLSIMVLPIAFAPNDDLTGARWAIGGAVSLAGLIAFFNPAPGLPLPDNVAANRARMDRWERDVAAVARENASRRAEIQLTVQAGPPRTSGPAR